MTARFIEVEKFNKPEFALALIENQIAELSERVGNYQGFKVNVSGNPDFPYSQKTETSRREVDALFVAQEMARRGFDNFLWISPPGGDPEHPYPGSRFTWLKVVNVTPNYIYFDDNKAICGEVGPEECVALAKCLVEGGGEVWGEIKSPEDLRCYVVGFKDDQVIERLAGALGKMEEVWSKIRKGDDKKNLGRMLEVADWVEDEFGARMKGVKTEMDSIRLGAMIERQVRQRFGIKLMVGGSHGMSNEAALQKMQTGRGVFDQVYYSSKPMEMDSRLEYCEIHHICYIKKKGKCPLCVKE